VVYVAVNALMLKRTRLPGIHRTQFGEPPTTPAVQVVANARHEV
jgi:hypothetical protein